MENGVKIQPHWWPQLCFRFSTYHSPGSHHSPGHRYRKYGYKLVSGSQPQLRAKTSPQAQVLEMEKSATAFNKNRNLNSIAPLVTKAEQRQFPHRIPAPLSIPESPVPKSQPPPPPPQPSPAPPVTRQPPPPPSPAPIFRALPPAPSSAPAPAPAPVLPQAVPAVPGNVF